MFCGSNVKSIGISDFNLCTLYHWFYPLNSEFQKNLTLYSDYLAYIIPIQNLLIHVRIYVRICSFLVKLWSFPMLITLGSFTFCMNIKRFWQMWQYPKFLLIWFVPSSWKSCRVHIYNWNLWTLVSIVITMEKRPPEKASNVLDGRPDGHTDISKTM